MGLILPPWYFTQTTDNLHRVAAPSATPGQNFTPGNSNADGTTVNIAFANRADSSTVTAIEFDVYRILIGIGGIIAANTDTACLLDLMIDRAGGTSYSAFIDDLVCGFSSVPAAGTIALSQYYDFPIFAPAGSSFGIRARCAAASAPTTGRFAMWIFGNPSRPDVWWAGQGVESLGVVPSTSKGANHTAGNGAWSTWASVGSTTTKRYQAVQFGHNGSDSGSAAISTMWEIGYSSQRLAGSPRFHTSMSTGETVQRNGFGVPIFCDVPVGTQMQVRGWGSGAGEVNTVAIYGVY